MFGTFCREYHNCTNNLDTSIDKSNLRQHINSLLNQMTREGILTRGRWYERNWLEFRVVDHIVKSTIRDALDQGCHPWDHVLFHLSTLIVQTATCC